MTDWKLIGAYLVGLFVFYIVMGWLHVRSMNQLDDSKEYTMREELNPKTIFLNWREHPSSLFYSLSIVLFMVALRYDNPFVAVVGSVTLIGTAWWSNRKKDDSDENESVA